MRNVHLAVSVVIAVVSASCGGSQTFRLSSDENNPYALEQALAQRQLPARPTPVNAAHQPRVFVVQSGAPKTILAYDLAAQKQLWKAEADVQSRIAVGGDFVAAFEGAQIVGRDQDRGSPRWKASPLGTFVAIAADAQRAYVVSKQGNSWWLAAYDGRSGDLVWKSEAAGQLGAPAAHGGVVYVPFLRQWLSIVDGKTGGLMTRVRGLDEQISMVRATSQVAYYGSKQGVFRLDAKSASGKRADASYRRVAIPAQLERTSYGRDAYDPVQHGYSAADRARVLWSSEPSNDSYAIHYFRYVFGFDHSGALQWVYNHPRVELVASDHTGHAIVGVATNGDLVAIDPKSGGIWARANVGSSGSVLGATFDADGWTPPGQPAPVDYRATLADIGRDRDARFDRVKELAVAALAKLPGADVTTELLAVLSDARASDRLKEVVVEQLIQRKDPASLSVLTAQLAVRTDYIAKTEADGVGSIAKAIGGLGDLPLDPKHREAAVAALQFHLDAPTIASVDRVHVISALAALGGNAARLALAGHCLLYHADQDLGGNPAWQKAIVEAMVPTAKPHGPAERAVMRQVADDPRSEAGFVAMIRDALARD